MGLMITLYEEHPYPEQRPHFLVGVRPTWAATPVIVGNVDDEDRARALVEELRQKPEIARALIGDIDA